MSGKGLLETDRSLAAEVILQTNVRRGTPRPLQDLHVDEMGDADGKRIGQRITQQAHVRLGDPDLDVEVKSGGKGSHRKFMHPGFAGAVTLSGMPGDDAKPYQEQQVGRAVEEVSK